MLKTVFNILLGTSEWRLADTGKRSIHHYYESDKTGDRKVVTQKHPPQKRRKQMRPGYGYQPLDLVWLQSGSGKYYIDHEYVDTVKNPERRVSDKPPVPPKGPAGTARPNHKFLYKKFTHARFAVLRCLCRRFPTGF